MIDMLINEGLGIAIHLLCIAGIAVFGYVLFVDGFKPKGGHIVEHNFNGLSIVEKI